MTIKVMTTSGLVTATARIRTASASIPATKVTVVTYPSLVRKGGLAGSTGAASIQVPYPTGVVAGHALVLVWVGAVSAVMVVPAGWTLHPSATVTNGMRLNVIYTIATGTEAGTLTVTAQASGRISGQMFALPGIDPTTPLDVPPSNTTSAISTITLSELPVVTEGAILFYAAGSTNAGGATYTGQAKSTELADWWSDSGSASACMAGVFVDTVPVAAGATGPRTLVSSPARLQGAVMLALRPASS